MKVSVGEFTEEGPSLGSHNVDDRIHGRDVIDDHVTAGRKVASHPLVDPCLLAGWRNHEVTLQYHRKKYHNLIPYKSLIHCC